METIATVLVWDERFCIDESLIDEQHQRLFVLTNNIQSHLNQTNVSKLAVSESIGLFVDYATRHFEEEEAMMLERGYPLYHTHCAEHREFCTTIVEAAVDLVNDRLDLQDMLEFLADWLANHILSSDMAYKRYFDRKAAHKKLPICA